MEPGAGLIDERQGPESCDPLVRRQHVVDLRPKRCRVRRADRAAMKLADRYALEQPELRKRVCDVTAASYKFGAAWLETLADADNLPMPTEHLVPVIHALIEGLVFQRLLTPELVPDEVIYAAFGALAMPRART